jgi:diguanylate cyclase (GGDEF)-like protein/putative nucleotidyltransferase with HDIG domain
MNAYSLAPLFSAVAYIPLLISTLSARPRQKRHSLFLAFIIAAMVWGMVDLIFRSNFFQGRTVLLGELTLVCFIITSIQFHCFTSSFFPENQGRWLPFAYISLAVMILVVLLGFVSGGVEVVDDKLLPKYTIWVFVLVIPLIILVVRNYYVLWVKMRSIDNPIIHNQVVTIMLSISVLTVSILISILPVASEYPISHFGNLLVAVILSYAVIRHQLVDIKIVIREGTAWIGLGIIGVAAYWLILLIFHMIFDFDISFPASFATTGTAVIAAIFLYRLRGTFFTMMSRIFHGPSYEYRRKLADFTDNIHTVFNLKDQGAELLNLITKAIGIKQACLLFPETGSEDFTAQICIPTDNSLDDLKIQVESPIVKYLERERKPLTKENLTVLPEFLGLWSEEKSVIESKDMDFLLPLISRDRLIAILVLGKKGRGRYSLEEYNILLDITKRVAVTMEKEYLREQLNSREIELSVINNCSTIISSSLNIQEIFMDFVEELKKFVDVSWASIVLVEEQDLSCVALSSKVGSAYQVGDKIPMESSGTGWVVKNKMPLVEPDLSKEMKFETGLNFFKHGILSTVYLPLITKGDVIGSLILASQQRDAFSQQHIKLLNQLASQIAMPLENARLYAETEEKARVDELTGLLNRRSLDEMIDAEISRHSRYGGVFTLAILDLDSFKTYNDTKGHPAGDVLLTNIGNIIKSMIRNSDFAFRYGGDEFAILLPQTSIDSASQVTERVRESIAKEYENGDINITASIGLASWPEDGMSHSDIIAAADLTLYRAKWSGGNKIFCASGTLSNLYFTEANTFKRGSNNRIVSIIYNLAETIDSRSPRTRNHSKNVAEYAVALAKTLDINTLGIRKLETCALLHDIGKIGISDEILDKEDELDEREIEIYKTHPELGANIVGHIPKLEQCARGIRHHHECFDGTGYPFGLEGEDIPLEARILAIASSFDTASTRDHRTGEAGINAALELIKDGAGAKFDPYLVERFVNIFEKESVKAGGNKHQNISD